VPDDGAHRAQWSRRSYACVSQLGADARHAIGFIAGDKRFTDLRRQHDVGLLALAHRTLQPTVEAAGRDLEGLAQGAHGEFGLIGCKSGRRRGKRLVAVVGKPGRSLCQYVALHLNLTQPASVAR
jgi:hypothetical protein